MECKIIFLLLILISTTLCAEEEFRNKLKEIYKWKTIDFEFKNEKARKEAIESKEFIPINNVPFGVERWRNKLFVTIPRRMPGVYSTLNYIDLRSKETSPKLIPYPNPEINRITAEGGNNSLISVYRINVDICNRLWLIDTGSVIDFEGNGVRLHPPRIKIIDLNSDEILKEYELKSSDFDCKSSFTNIIADLTGDQCEKSFAYIADPGSNSLVVYNFLENKSWRIKHPFFNIDPLSADFNIANINFQWDDGIFGISLSPPAMKNKNNNRFRKLYFHPMTSNLEFSISTEYLQNPNLVNKIYHKFEIVGSRGPKGQSSGSSLDEKTGILFYSLINKNAIGCWNSNRFGNEYSTNTTDIIFQNDESMIYSSDLKVDKNGYLWVISNRLPIVLYGSIDINDFNFRIFAASVNSVIKGTLCERIRGFWARTIN